MYRKGSATGWAVFLVLVSGVAPLCFAGPEQISIKDWARGGRAKSADSTISSSIDSPTTSPEPAPEPNPAVEAIPPAAMLPAIEAEPAADEFPIEPVRDQSGVDLIADAYEDPVLSAADATGPVLGEGDPAYKNASISGKNDVKTVTEWVARNDGTPEPDRLPESESVVVPPSQQMQGGQVRTREGVINLNAISLDRLNEELQKQAPPREELRLTLQECVHLVIQHNPDIQVTAYEPLKADADILSAKGEFDPTLKGTYSVSHSENTASSQTSAFTGSGLGGGSSGGLGNILGSLGSLNLLSSLGGGGGGGGSNNFTLGRLLLTGITTLASSAGNTVRNFVSRGEDTTLVIESDTTRYEATVSGKIPWGTQYEVKLEVNEEESTFSNFESEYSGGLTLTVRQPLLKGRGPKANLARIRIAKNNREVAENQLYSQIMSSVSDVVKAYWDLVGAEQQLEVREKSLENAQRLLDINQRRLEIGTAAGLEVVQAKASVAQRTSDVISARTQVLNAEDRLKLLLGLKDNDQFSHKRIVTADRPEVVELDLDETASVNRALENRPEIKNAHLEIDSAELERYRAANDMQMQLDVQGSVFQGARGDKARTVFDGITERDDNSYSLQVTGSIPITNRQGRGAYEKALQSKRQSQQRLHKTMDEIVISVRNAIRAAASSRIIAESSGQARALQETNVAAEEKRLKLGATTSFEVLRVQEDLANARAQEVQAIVDLEKALVDLQVAEGTILGAMGVEYEMPEPEKNVSFIRSIVPPTVKDE
ncbi:MAG: hypothetical protein AMXMBFR4_24380 [Candidatus Hydrogenedentota bacterium]